MAFSYDNFGEWAGGEAKGQIQVLYSYHSGTDNLATQTASGYFDKLVGQLQKNDILWISGADDGEFVKVTSTTGATPVTVAKITGDAGNIPLPQGNALAGNASGVAAAVDISANGSVLMGNGTNAVAKAFVARPTFYGQHAYAGGGTSTDITITGLATSDRVAVTLTAATNAVTLGKCVVTANTLTVHFSADPGAATTVDYVVFSAP